MTNHGRSETRASLRELPKAEVHVHLEGAFEPATLEKWANEAGIAMPRPRERLFEFQGLGDFLQFLDWACGLVNSGDRLAEMAYGFSRRLADDGEVALLAGKGIPLGICPTSSLPAEYELARTAFGWTGETVRELARTSIDASFANAETKARLISKLSHWATH